MNDQYKAVLDMFERNPQLEFKPRLIDFEEFEAQALGILGDNLLEYRKSVNLSQSNMAKILGVSLSQYKKYEQGLDVLKIDMAQRWSLRFCTPFFHLLQGSVYDSGEITHRMDKQYNFIWFLANSLTDDYFGRLVEMICLFVDKNYKPKAPEPSQIERRDIEKVLTEINEKMYIIIAYGLQAFRAHFNVNQEKMAELLNISLATYQQYERPTMNPRMHMFIAARFYVAAGINPLFILHNTHYSRVRNMQNERMTLLQEIIDNMDEERMMELKPLVNGFATMAKSVPGATIVDI